MIDLTHVSPLPRPITDFLLELASNAKVDRLIIFGSRACGDYDDYSDVDLAIDAKKFDRSDWANIREAAYYDVPTVLAISISNYWRNPDRIRQRIMENGALIYEKKQKVT